MTLVAYHGNKFIFVVIHCHVYVCNIISFTIRSPFGNFFSHYVFYCSICNVTPHSPFLLKVGLCFGSYLELTVEIVLMSPSCVHSIVAEEASGIRYTLSWSNWLISPPHSLDFVNLYSFIVHCRIPTHVFPDYRMTILMLVMIIVIIMMTIIIRIEII